MYRYTQAEELGAVLYQCLETLRIACVLLEPFLPNKMAEAGLYKCVCGTAKTF